MKRTGKRKILFMLSGMTAAMFLFFAMPSESRAYVQASGMVTADAAKVRKEPSTQSDSLSSLLKGTMVTVIDETKDSAGTLWYKVSYENSTGFIRSDLMLKATTTETTTTAASKNTSATATLTTTTGTSSAATAASKPAATQVTTIAETKAYVNYKSARVRQGASTKHEIVGSAVENTPVVITGEANGTDGRKWYQVRYTNQNGREVVGFIRADLVTVGDPPAAAATEAPAETPAEAPAETPAEQPEGGESGEGGEAVEGGEGGEEQPDPEPEPAPEETTRPDYEMIYQANSEGVEEWFLLDNINNTQQSLENLRMWADTGERLTQEADKQGSVQKIIIIVLAALAAILAVTVAILLFKLKDVYEDEDEEDEDDEDDEEEEEDEDDEEEEEIERVVRRRRPAPGMTERPERIERAERPQRQEKTERAERPQRQAAAPAPRPAAKARPVAEKERRPVPVKRMEYEPEEESEVGQPVVQKPQPKRKPKNFLIEDDEFEFEFLNMDDKK